LQLFAGIVNAIIKNEAIDKIEIPKQLGKYDFLREDKDDYASFVQYILLHFIISHELAHHILGHKIKADTFKSMDLKRQIKHMRKIRHVNEHDADILGSNLLVSYFDFYENNTASQTLPLILFFLRFLDFVYECTPPTYQITHPDYIKRYISLVDHLRDHQPQVYQEVREEEAKFISVLEKLIFDAKKEKLLLIDKRKGLKQI